MAVFPLRVAFCVMPVATMIVPQFDDPSNQLTSLAAFKQRPQSRVCHRH
jgi:hypothetical protein